MALWLTASSAARATPQQKTVSADVGQRFCLPHGTIGCNQRQTLGNPVA
jgi:hypothetical protein